MICPRLDGYGSGGVATQSEFDFDSFPDMEYFTRNDSIAECAAPVCPPQNTAGEHGAAPWQEKPQIHYEETS